MATLKTTTTTASTDHDTAFHKHVDAVREALVNFNAISFLNAPGPAKSAMEELLSVTVRTLLIF